MLFMFLFNMYYAYLAQQGAQTAEISYTRFRGELTADNIKKIGIKGSVISGEFRAKIKVSEQRQGKTAFGKSALSVLSCRLLPTRP